MSIPGLGQLPIKANAAFTRQSVTLQPFWEWRFQIAHNSDVTVRLVNGVAERDGTELALNKSYTFRGTKGAIFTHRGCTLDFEGQCDHQYVAEMTAAENNPMVSYQNLHFLLQGLRSESGPGKKYTTGPRIMIVGPSSAGKTTLARTLTAYAIKNGGQPLVVNTDPREGMLSLPGTVTAAVFPALLDIEGEGTNGWGGTPTSGPSAVPVKLPIVYYYGHQHATDDAQLYKEVVSSLASAVTSRMSAHARVKTSGLIIDTPAIHGTGKLADQELDAVEHIVDEFSVNLILALGSAEIGSMMEKRFNGKNTSLGDAINVCILDKSTGVVQSDEAWLLESQHAAIKNYFYGDSKGSLSSPKQTVDFDTVTIYRLPDPSNDSSDERGLLRIDPSPALSHCTLPIMNASVGDSPDTIRTASVQGFVYIADVVKDRQKLVFLTPIPGDMGRKPLLLGVYPEQYINLIG